ncbi:uncharacterized protein LOC120846255 [Ixodes scapularis]|uniref:uncharacterized protein LOC120846255 n=1 Tax=Ixodes scapularis TaxID=6945 RepID=UPI001A9E5AE2|nr:uncharacterized protein LOC120846255 [Ixodes scapularis]
MCPPAFHFKDLGYDTLTKDAAKIVKAECLRLRKHKIIQDKKYFPMTYEFAGRHTSTIHQELRKLDYVSTGELIFRAIDGPEIMYAWQFREAFAQTVGQAQECDLFSRAEALQECKIKYQTYSVGVSTEPEVLTLGDLVPFFLIWCVGLGAAVLILVLEVASAYLRVLCVKPRRRNKQVLFKKPRPFKRRKQRLDMNQCLAY